MKACRRDWHERLWYEKHWVQGSFVSEVCVGLGRLHYASLVSLDLAGVSSHLPSPHPSPILGPYMYHSRWCV